MTECRIQFSGHCRDQARGPKFRPKWDPGRSVSLPKKKIFFFFFRETHFHSVTIQMQAVVTSSDNLLPLHPVSPSIKNGKSICNG